MAAVSENSAASLRVSRTVAPVEVRDGDLGQTRTFLPFKTCLSLRADSHLRGMTAKHFRIILYWTILLAGNRKMWITILRRGSFLFDPSGHQVR
jgi:hypothetical protein